jgi:hypothetical protein
MVFEKFVIVQHRDTLWYVTIHGGRYWSHIWKYTLGDYVYLEQTTLTMLDVIVGCVMLRTTKESWF